MYSELEVTEVLNTPEELKAFPVEGTVNILFKGKPNPVNVGEYAYLVRHDNDMDVNLPGISDGSMRQVGYVQVDRYDKIESTIIFTEETVDESWVLSFTPQEALITNAAYFLVLSKYLVPEYYEVNKTISYGPSEVSINTEQSATSEVADWTIEIITESVLSAGSHIIEFSVLKDGGSYAPSVTLNIRRDNFILSEGIEVVFSPDIPFLIGETFTISTTDFTGIEDTLIQNIETNIHSDIIAPSEEIQSERINNADIVKFYEDNGWTQRTCGTDEEVLNEPVNPGDPIVSDISSRFINPGTIIIDCGAEISPYSLIDSVFNIDISYAFNNFVLPEMGYYNEDAQYVIYYSIVDKNFIKLETQENTELVPPGQQFILLPRI
ncbi:MAG: hypothetical protein DRQ78_00015 [Epsilonproteobacteria bacterium]|nr:MAG: hypothetical protein DRQ78_00015 [Campylobacterota bacterium]